MEENRFYVYRHIRLDKNEPFYVGIGTKPAKYKAYSNEYRRAFCTRDRSSYWKRIANKHGYKVEIIFESNNYDEIISKEIEFIALYGREDIGTGILVNHTDGGEGRKNQSEEARKEQGQKLRKKLSSPEEKNKISARLKEIWKNPQYASLRSNQSKEMWKDPAYREKMDKNLKDRWSNPDYISKMKSVRDKVFSDPVYMEKLKIRTGELNSVIVVDKENGIFYDSLTIACEALNLPYYRERSRMRRKSKKSRFIRVDDDKEINDKQIKSI